MPRILTLVVGVAVLSGCGGKGSTPETKKQVDKAAMTQAAGQAQGGFETPEAAFNAFEKAATDGDIAKAIGCLSPESQQMMAGMLSIPLAMSAAFDPEKGKDVKALFERHGVSMDDEATDFPADKIPDIAAYISDVLNWLDENSDKDDEGMSLGPPPGSNLGEVTIDGDTASATLTLAEGAGEENVEFIRIDGRWFVHITAEMGAGDEFEMGDPGAFNEGGFGAGGFGGFEPDPPEAPLEAVSLDDFNAAWQVTLDAQDQAAGDVLTQLASGLNLEFDASSLGQSANKPVTLKLAAQSRFVGIEEVASQLEMTPVYTATTLTFKPGARAVPAAFAGPLLIELSELTTEVETATGQLTLRAFSGGLPPVVLQRLLEDGFGGVQIGEIKDGQGHSLRRLHGSGESYQTNEAKAFDRELFVRLRGLLRSVVTIPAVTGGLQLTVPTQVELLTFDELKSGTSKKAGGLTLTLSQANGTNLTFEYEGGNGDGIQLLAFDESGDRIEAFGSGGFGGGDSGTLTRSYESSPARIEARVATATEDLEYNFEMKGLVVPDADQRPEQLAELTWDGDAPMTVEFVRFSGDENFRRIVFRVQNKSSKDAESLRLRLSYRDGGGKELKDTSSSPGSEVIGTGESSEVEVPAFFMPEETKSVTASVERIEFTDASEWKPEK